MGKIKVTNSSISSWKIGISRRRKMKIIYKEIELSDLSEMAILYEIVGENKEK